MNVFLPCRHIAAVSLMVLAGCGGSSTTVASNQLPNGRTSHVPSRSWVSPAAKSTRSLLYVSDAANNEVYIYTYPATNLVGILTGFTNPHGLCVSRTTGEVLVANTGASDLLWYKHGEVLPEATLKDKGQYPLDCSINTKGYAAVSNTQTVNGGAGSVTVFGPDKTYAVSNMNIVDYLSYDRKGDIYVDGTDASGGFQFAELINGRSAFTPVILNQAIGRPGGVQFNGKYVAVGDESTNIVYLTNRGHVVGSTVLGDASEVVDFFIQQNTIIGPDDGNASVGLWTFPAGGAPFQVITGAYLSKPTGAAVSTI